MTKQQWRDFATAPTDGTEILAWREDAGAFSAFYKCDDDTDEDGCWFAVSGEDLTGDLPTCWMPYPEPPPTPIPYEALMSLTWNPLLTMQPDRIAHVSSVDPVDEMLHDIDKTQRFLESLAEQHERLRVRARESRRAEFVDIVHSLSRLLRASLKQVGGFASLVVDVDKEQGIS